MQEKINLTYTHGSLLLLPNLLYPQVDLQILQSWEGEDKTTSVPLHPWSYLSQQGFTLLGQGTLTLGLN
jgi:hypothetical protein